MSSCHKIFKVKTGPMIQLSGRALSSCTRFKQNQNFLLEVSGVTVSPTGVGRRNWKENTSWGSHVHFLLSC